jgi:predicted membrane-bound dolichyl-phosphate-mannose-protein mannosyltransferase
MCVNRGLSFIETFTNPLLRDRNLYILKALRSDKEYFQVSIPTDINGKIAVEDLTNALKTLESCRNCECPYNKDCHKEINGKLNIIIAKE